uniref:Uncharacterized protein n=1 Tax=Vertebrata isogona TaxID=2006944 RepID=A0A1Z1MF97_9FLOR|nr:hypothetical protein [Vertebrata isogona]ARW64646.1 hypothetical protein [Vertebrata isogona]
MDKSFFFEIIFIFIVINLNNSFIYNTYNKITIIHKNMKKVIFDTII